MKKRFFLKATAASSIAFLGGCAQTVPRTSAAGADSALTTVNTTVGLLGQLLAVPPGNVASSPASASAPVQTRRELGGLPTAQEQQQAREIFEVVSESQPGTALMLGSLSALAVGKQSLQRIWPTLRPGPEAVQAVVTNLARPAREVVRLVVAQTTGAQGLLPKPGVPKVNASGEFTIPAGTVCNFDLKGYCMDAPLPAPVKDDALFLVPAASRVQPELLGLYRALVGWMSQPKNQDVAAFALWTLTEAGTSSSRAVSPSPAVLRAFNEAMPNGAAVFQRFHDSRMGSTRQRPAVDSGPDDVGNPAAVRQLLDFQVAQGVLLSDGRGVGYIMLAPGVAARGIGTSMLIGNYQVVNATIDPFVFGATDYVAVPAVRKQGVSGTTQVGSPAYAEPALDQPFVPADSLNRLRDLNADLEAYVRQPVFKGQLNWIGQPLRAGLITDRALAKLRQYDDEYPVKAAISAMPVLGNLMALYEAATGRDWLYDTELSAADRALAALSTMPGENTLRLGLRGLEKLGVLGREAMAVQPAAVSIGSKIGQEAVAVATTAVDKLRDSIIDTVFFRTPYQTLQTMARAERTDVAQQRWSSEHSDGASDPASPLYQDPNAVFNWVADGSFQYDPGVRNVIDQVASRRVRIPY